ncbi:MAG: hypothetical protein GF418_06325 [Chitinivibrionales bacterium]|nr:hypothetical protein [Chitinivibrionales bacterium]MBD3395227.1 hypothetical protein [Chitinivibrionales bacterium]
MPRSCSTDTRNVDGFPGGLGTGDRPIRRANAHRYRTGRSHMKLMLSIMLAAAAGVPLAQEEAPVLDTAGSGRETIAVLELHCNGIPGGECAGLSNRLRSELFETRRFDVVERSRMDDILKEQGFQQTGCTDEACAIEIGQLLNVKAIALGSVDKVGSTISVTARLVDVSTGKIRHSVVEDCQGCALDAVLVESMKAVAARLCGERSGEDAVAPHSEALRPDLEKKRAISKNLRKKPRDACRLRVTAEREIPVYVEGKNIGPTPVDAPLPEGRHRVSAYNLKELSRYKDQLKRLEKSRNRRDRALAKAIRERLKLGTVVVTVKPGACPPRIHFELRETARAKRPIFVAREMPD